MQLGKDEIDLLRSGLAEWGGPAHAKDELAVAMGFEDVADLYTQVHRLQEAVSTDGVNFRTTVLKSSR